MDDLRNGLTASDAKTRSTITRAFKFAGVKEADKMSLEILLEDLIKKISDSDLHVKRNALESLINIVHNHPDSFRQDAICMEMIQKLSFAETVIRPDLITEVDLGPFKHKVDNGIPIRKFAYGLIYTLVDKVPEKTNVTAIMDIILKGMEDTAEECQIQSL